MPPLHRTQRLVASPEPDRQRLHPVDDGELGEAQVGRLAGEREVGEATGQRDESGAQLHPGQLRADAPVQPVSEGERAGRRRGGVEARGVDVAGRVAPGSGQRDDDDVARPHLLVIDEVGYLSYSNRHADLMFELISRRYQNRSTLVTTNRNFAEWREVFPNAACVVSLVDRLLHNSEIVAIEGDSYRLKEAHDRTEQRARQRRGAKS